MRVRAVYASVMMVSGLLLAPFLAKPAYGQAAGRNTSTATASDSGKLPPNSSQPSGSDDQGKVSGSQAIVTYCSHVAADVQDSAGLEKACEFSLAMRGKLPDVICDQQTTRSWSFANSKPDVGFPPSRPTHERQLDVVTAKVSYRNGHEYYDNVRVNGKPVGNAASWMQGGTWSIGEFASILSGIFEPSTKAEFRYEKQEKLHSVATLVFSYRVQEENNKTYSIDSGGEKWFPGYAGKFWIDKKTFELRKLERETTYMPHHPVRDAKTTVEYNDVSLGDGTALNLPTNSQVMICLAPSLGSPDACTQNAIKFNNWHKFGAKATIVMDSPN